MTSTGIGQCTLGIFPRPPRAVTRSWWRVSQPFCCGSLFDCECDHVVPADRGHACRKVGTGDGDYLPPSPSSSLFLVKHIFQHIISCRVNRHEATGGGGIGNSTIASSAAAGATCGSGGVSFLILGRL